MIIDADVVIIGAGPAGVACAYSLGKNNITTCIIDRKKMDKIGDKVCGDAYNPYFFNRAYDLVGLPRPDENNGELKEILEFMFLQGTNPDYSLNIGNLSATVDRLKYGQALLKAVNKSDTVTVFSETRLKSLLVEDNNLIGIVASSKSEDIEINAKIIVDASGSRAVVRSKLPESMLDKMPRKLEDHELLIAYREILRTDKPHNFQKGLYVITPKEIEDVMPAYFWIFSRGEYEVNIGLGYPKTEKNKGKNIKQLNSILRDKYFENYKILDGRGDHIPARLPLPSLVHNGFITVGDAGALVNPMNGEGHAPAIFSGIYAADTIIHAIKTNNFTEKQLWDYNKKIWNEYGLLHSLGVFMVPLLSELGVDTVDWLIKNKIITKEDIASDIDDPNVNIGKSIVILFKLMRKPKLLVALIKTKLKIAKLQKHCLNYPDIDNFEEWNNTLNSIVQSA